LHGLCERHSDSLCIERDSFLVYEIRLRSQANSLPADMPCFNKYVKYSRKIVTLNIIAIERKETQTQPKREMTKSLKISSQ